MKLSKNYYSLLLITVYVAISINGITSFKNSFLNEKSLSNTNSNLLELNSNNNNESSEEYEIIQVTDDKDANKKSKHQRLGNSILSRVLLYEGSISHLLAKNEKLDKTKAITVKNDDVVSAFKEIFGCKTKLDSLKKIKEAFDKSFKDGLITLSEMGTFKADGKFSYEIKAEHKGGACEDKKEADPLDKPPEPFSYKGGRGKGK